MAAGDYDRAERQRELIRMAGALAGATLLPWLTWIAAGCVGCVWLTAASFAIACVYIVCIHRLGVLEHARRKAKGRRYEPLSPATGTSVAIGLAICFILPGLSASALAARIGLPRLEGTVQSYEPDDLAGRGARIAFEPWVGLPRERIEILAGLTATVLVPGADGIVVFGTTWLPDGRRVCIRGSGLWCLNLDPGSGRLSDRGVTVGRISHVGIGGGLAASRVGLPWELENLFRNADLL